MSDKSIMIDDYTDLDDETYLDVSIKSGKYIDLYVSHKVIKKDSKEYTGQTIFQCVSCGSIYEDDENALCCCDDVSNMSTEINEDWCVELPSSDEEFEKIYGKF